jgi:hypothetical protein
MVPLLVERTRFECRKARLLVVNTAPERSIHTIHTQFLLQIVIKTPSQNEDDFARKHVQINAIQKSKSHPS